MSAVGSLRKVVLDGTTYDVMSDTNINFKPSNYEIEGVPTSGKNMMKMTKRVKTVESCDLGVNVDEMTELSGKSDGLADITMAFELADGSTYRGTGRIHIDSYESETGKMTLTLIPVGDWTPFPA